MKSISPGRLRRVLAVLAALSVVALGATLASPSAGAQPAAEPFFAVSPVEPADHMWGEGWLPESEVQIDIDDPTVGGAVDFTTTIPTNGDGGFGVFDLPFDIQAGQEVTVSQGDSVKTHDIIDLTISDVDPVADTVSGVGAADTLTYVNHPGGQVVVTSDATGAWTADLSNEFDIMPGNTIYVFQADEDWDQTQIDFHVEVDEPECTIEGTSGNDWLYGTRGDDVICGLGGNDKLFGFGGDDVLVGGEGRDRLFGGAGDDQLLGGGGNDRLYGWFGDDTISGGDGNDKLWGFFGNDDLDGGTGSDRCVTGRGSDTTANCET